MTTDCLNALMKEWRAQTINVKNFNAMVEELVVRRDRWERRKASFKGTLTEALDNLLDDEE